MRWEEEVELLQEEMRRVLAFLHSQAAWWTEQGERWKGLPPDLSAGLRAYAHRQGDCRRELADHFRHIWRHVSAYVELGISGAETEDLEMLSPEDDEDA